MINAWTIAAAFGVSLHLKLPPARNRCCRCHKEIGPGRPNRKCKDCRDKDTAQSAVNDTPLNKE